MRAKRHAVTSARLACGCTLGFREGQPGSPVTVGLRPEHFVPTDHGVLELEVDLAEPLGADTLLHGRFGHARELVTVRLPGNVPAKPGEKRRYAVSPERLHLFDAQTGKRLAGT